MPQKSCKIFLARDGQEPVEFMWAEVASDESVMIGLLGEAFEEVEFAVDQERGELRKPVLVTERSSPLAAEGQLSCVGSVQTVGSHGTGLRES